MIQNFIFGILFFENITSGMMRFYICFDVSADTTRVIFLRKKKIFCVYGCFSVSRYIKGGRKSQLETIEFLDKHVV